MISIRGNLPERNLRKFSADQLSRKTSSRNMADDELAAIRAARLKELQQQSGQVKALLH